MKSKIRKNLAKSGRLGNYIVRMRILQSSQTEVINVVKRIMIAQMMWAGLAKPIKSEWETTDPMRQPD